MRNLHQIVDWTLLAAVMAGVAIGAAGIAGCERKETIIDVQTPGADIEVDRDKRTGTVEVDVDRDK